MTAPPRATSRRAKTVFAAGLALAMTIAACGDDDDDGAAPTSAPAATSAETPAETSGGTGTRTTTGDTGTGTTTGDTGTGTTPGTGEPLDAGVDDGSTITMWTRAATEAQSQRFVDAYNASHENQVDLTVIPTDDYLPRVGTAAGAGELPDVLSLDVVFVPQFTTVGAFLDITDRIAELPFADDIAPSHMEVGTLE